MISLFFLILAVTNARADETGFKLMRQDENYSSLKGTTSLKHIPLNDDQSSYLSFGGEIRERYEYYSNYLWGRPLNRGDGYFLHRIMAHSDFHLENCRFFVQLKSNTVSGKDFPPRPIDKDELDLHQAFFEYHGIRLGRQELNYGSGRIVSVREGPNVRQSFDAIKYSLKEENYKLDAFVSRPVESNPDVFDDSTDNHRALYGIYSTLFSKLDLYYLGYFAEGAKYERGTGDEHRHSFGTRFFSSGKNFDYDYEALYQLGKFAEKNISAWTIATNTGYTFSELPLLPRIGFKADIASGDRKKGNGFNTFNPLFPKGAYFNEEAILGPANRSDIHPTLDLKITEKLTVRADWDFIWRNSLNDGLYNISMSKIQSENSPSRQIGSQLAFSTDYQISKNLYWFAQYVHFYAGNYLKDVSPGEDINYLTSWLTFKI